MGQKVLVTGFGPFGGFEKNPSQLLVEELEDWKPEGEGIQLITQILPVTYNIVGDAVEDIWTNQKPDLLVHVGVHGYTDSVLIESQSFNYGYCRKDVTSNVPLQNCCVVGTEPILETKIDVPQLIKNISDTNADNDDCLVPVKQSCDPGRYLCAYSYYLSLSKDSFRVLFIHIPSPKGSITLHKLAETLKRIIMSALKQIQ